MKFIIELNETITITGLLFFAYLMKWNKYSILNIS